MAKGLLDTKTTIGTAKEIADNTKNAIDNYSLGAMNPSLPNTEYWAKMAKMFRITPAEVKRQRCGNCEYYRAKFSLSKAKSAASELVQELQVVESALVRVNKSLPTTSIKLDPDVFKQEIAALLLEATKLNEEQEKIRAKTFTLGSEKQSLQSQVAMAKNSLKELEGDLKYLTDTKPQESMLCPTCGVEHENGFSVRLELIDDASQLRNIIAELEHDQRKVEETLACSLNELSALRVKSDQIKQTLQSKKGALRLQDVVESQSAEVIRVAFTTDIDSLGRKLEDQQADVASYKEKLEKFDLPERTKEINEYYSEHMELFLSELGVADIKEDLKKKPDASLVASGSALPRTILAYQFAVLHTAKEKGDAKLFPIVVDSPNQQGVKGSPDNSKRNDAFKARHAENIAKGKMSAAYWANKVKW